MGQHFLDMGAAFLAPTARPATGIGAAVRFATRRGFVAAGDLRAGDGLLTRDSGYCAIRGITPLGFLPCGSPAGAALWLRPDHGVLRRDANGEEVLAPLRRLLSPGQVQMARHLVLAISLDRHEVLCAEGGWIESEPGPSGIPARPRADLSPAADAMRNFRVAGGGGRT